MADVPEEFWNTLIRRVLSPRTLLRLGDKRMVENAGSWCDEIEQATLNNLPVERAVKALKAFRYARKEGPAERVKRFAKIHAWAFCRRKGARPERYRMESEYIVDRLLQGESWEGWRTFDGIKKCMVCQETFKNPFLLAKHTCVRAP